MTSVPAEPAPWPLRRWGAIIALVFGVQLGLIFRLGSTAPIRPRPAAMAPTLHFAGHDSTELQALTDPTLFTLPHPQGFSGPAWRRMTPPDYRSFEWTAPTNHLPLALDQLGAVFNQLLEAGDFTPLHLPTLPEPAPTLPDLPPPGVWPAQSLLELEGGLAQQRLLAPLELKSQAHQDILANSIVQVVVDADGRPVSATLLSKSGSATADQDALEQAMAARFEPVSSDPTEPVPNPTAHLTWGRMIFHWHTVPLPPASGPAASQ